MLGSLIGSFLSVPNPADIVNGILTGKLEREFGKALLSAAFSAQIAFLWAASESRIPKWLGLGKAFKDMATAIYCSLEPIVDKTGSFVVVEPQAMAVYRSQFLAEYNSKKL